MVLQTFSHNSRMQEKSHPTPPDLTWGCCSFSDHLPQCDPIIGWGQGQDLSFLPCGTRTGKAILWGGNCCRQSGRACSFQLAWLHGARFPFWSIYKILRWWFKSKVKLISVMLKTTSRQKIFFVGGWGGCQEKGKFSFLKNNMDKPCTLLFKFTSYSIWSQIYNKKKIVWLWRMIWEDSPAVQALCKLFYKCLA